MLGRSTITFDPLLPNVWILALVGLALSLAVLAVWARSGAGFRQSGAALQLLLRTALIGVIALTLLNPQTVVEDRTPLNDIVLVLTDISQSAQIGQRADVMARHKAKLMERLGAQDTLDIVQATIPAGADGTRLVRPLLEAISDIPLSRFAGVIALTDGQIHDLPENPQNLLPDGVPFHGLIIGDPTRRDRRIRPIRAPKYGLVDEQAEFDIQVDDPGHEGEDAWIDIKLNGDLQARFPVTIGNLVTIPVKIERRGLNTIELSVEPALDELTLANNSYISEFSGIRDRLQVLLVTGNPHIGGRAWRNLLKSDPSVDLVQFTILTNPLVKRPNATQRELSLIAFPTRQLFEEKLDSFDLVIFDQFQRRFRPGRSGRVTSILQPYYLQNIANYVEAGGALLVATGPPFASEESLYRSPLAAVLPARPTGDLLETPFTPTLNSKGRRHPITAGFSGREDTRWGPWFRLIESQVVSGHVLMEGPDAEPLLVVDKVGDGRVAMLMSDQAWLWAKDYKGGGPYSEMFRRLAHWLMGEPDLEAERLTGRIENSVLSISRRTLTEGAQDILVQSPDGSSQTVTLAPSTTGVYTAQVPAPAQGAYRLSQGNISAVSAAGALNPKEFSDLRPTSDKLKPLVKNSGGGLFLLNRKQATLPDIERVNPKAHVTKVKSTKPQGGMDALSLIRHGAYRVDASRRMPFAPELLFFILIFILSVALWWHEGK